MVMKKVKIEERLESAVNAFFATGDDKNASALVFANDSAVLPGREDAAFTEKAELWTNAARQMFLFLPGAFLLFFTTLTGLYFVPQIGFSSQMLFWLAAGGFLCLAGSGSLRNTRNPLVPFSIVLFAALFGILFSLFPADMQTALYFDRSIYLFPFVLVSSKLLQNWLDEK